MQKSEDLIFIEECFSAIKNKDDIPGNIGRIERTLSRMFDIKFEISIADNTTHKFFGINIYPTIPTMEHIAQEIINENSPTESIVEIWQSSKEWYLEIDSLLLYSSSLNTNPSEIASVMIHEIGEVLYSSSVPSKFNKIIRTKVGALNYRLKALIKHDKIRTLFNLSIIEACTAKNYEYLNLTDDTNAEKFIVKMGYADTFNEFITKLISVYGNSLVNRSEEDVNGDIELIVNWTINNIYYLEVKKSQLKIALRTEMLKSPSDIIKKNIQHIYGTFFGNVTDRYRELLSEQWNATPVDKYAEIRGEQYLNNLVQRIVTEADKSILDKVGKVKKVKQLDLDILAVDVEKISTNDDKIYLLDRLYDLLDTVNTGIEYHSTGRSNKVSQSAETLKRMRDQLYKTRDQILATKVIEKEYGVFIKYPKGYTG